MQHTTGELALPQSSSVSHRQPNKRPSLIPKYVAKRQPSMNNTDVEGQCGLGVAGDQEEDEKCGLASVRSVCMARGRGPGFGKDGSLGC
mmetsp:Transcript_88878/g.194756  ORF Transcript_88878/g.194756 Transcript_88878/m.194756 type:complete len:89 (-) Transcript_88878:189-455(-)